jgi:hypothetical protein
VYDRFRAGATDKEIADELYLAAFARYPSAQEWGELQELIAATPSREQALQDLLWAVLSSREFAENH